MVQEHFIICIFDGTMKWVCFLFNMMLYLATRVYRLPEDLAAPLPEEERQ